MTKRVNDPAKKNVCIMGRKTYFGIPEARRPLAERINVVLTSKPEDYKFPPEVIVATSLKEALEKIQNDKIASQIENVWIVGGYSVYKEAMESPICGRVYLTRVLQTFECDAFFPELSNNFNLVPNDSDIPTEVQEENGIKYKYEIYERIE
jgi:dihydrofolate reductase